MNGLVLSLFPGIGLLDMAFEEEGFCVVRGPDLLWGSDIRHFHPPAGRFDGVIGGPPCQAFSELAFLVRANGDEPKFGDLIPEFSRVVREAMPAWWLMENVSGAPAPDLLAHSVRLLSNRALGGEQSRDRKFWAGGVNPWPYVEFAALEALNWSPAVTGDMRVATNGRRVRTKPGGGIMPHVGELAPFDEMLRLQGLPAEFIKHSPFTSKAKRQMIGNGVPLVMGRAIARAVRHALAR